MIPANQGSTSSSREIISTKISLFDGTSVASIHIFSCAVFLVSSNHLSDLAYGRSIFRTIEGNKRNCATVDFGFET